MTSDQIYNWIIDNWNKMSHNTRVKAMDKFILSSDHSYITGDDIVWILENQRF